MRLHTWTSESVLIYDSDLEVSYLRDPVKIKVLYMFTVLNLCLKGSLKSHTEHNREHSFMSQNIVECSKPNISCNENAWADGSINETHPMTASCGGD